MSLEITDQEKNQLKKSDNEQQNQKININDQKQEKKAFWKKHHLQLLALYFLYPRQIDVEIYEDDIQIQNFTWNSTRNAFQTRGLIPLNTTNTNYYDIQLEDLDAKLFYAGDEIAVGEIKKEDNVVLRKQSTDHLNVTVDMFTGAQQTQAYSQFLVDCIFQFGDSTMKWNANINVNTVKVWGIHLSVIKLEIKDIIIKCP